jgi:AcrR family transcriptional regulator
MAAPTRTPRTSWIEEGLWTLSSAGIPGAPAQLAATRGPSAATVGAIAESVGAPTGSIYHRFRSKDVLLAELLLQTVEGFQAGFEAALRSFARRALGSTSAAAMRRARYAVVELPYAAVISHVRGDESPPPIVDELVEQAYLAVVQPRSS